MYWQEFSDECGNGHVPQDYWQFLDLNSNLTSGLSWLAMSFFNFIDLIRNWFGLWEQVSIHGGLWKTFATMPIFKNKN